MGLLNLFSRSGAEVQRLPAGSMTIDCNGNVVTTTISSTYATGMLHDIAEEVLRLFREARQAQLSFSEINLHFASMQITARELRGGAIVFLSPKTSSFTTPSSTLTPL
jgi:hypothetical protein